MLLQGLPGGPELLVILLIALLLFGVPLALVVGLVFVLRRRRDRVAELEARVAELESHIDDRDSGAAPVDDVERERR